MHSAAAELHSHRQKAGLRLPGQGIVSRNASAARGHLISQAHRSPLLRFLEQTAPLRGRGVPGCPQTRHPAELLPCASGGWPPGP